MDPKEVESAVSVKINHVSIVFQPCVIKGDEFKLSGSNLESRALWIADLSSSDSRNRILYRFVNCVPSLGSVAGRSCRVIQCGCAEGGEVTRSKCWPRKGYRSYRLRSTSDFETAARANITVRWNALAQT